MEVTPEMEIDLTSEFTEGGDWDVFQYLVSEIGVGKNEAMELTTDVYKDVYRAAVLTTLKAFMISSIMAPPHTKVPVPSIMGMVITSCTSLCFGGPEHVMKWNPRWADDCVGREMQEKMTNDQTLEENIDAFLDILIKRGLLGVIGTPTN